MSRVLTPQNIRDLFENIIDDSVDDDFFYNLLNAANDELVGENDWEIFKAVDGSQSKASSDNYLTMKSLPSDFHSPRRCIYVGTTEYTPIAFEKRVQYKDTPRVYYIDYANSQFALCGAGGTAETINFFYNKIPTQILITDKDSSTIIKWPTLYRAVLAYKMAEIYQRGVDSDEQSWQMSAEQVRQYELLKRNLKSWDARLKLHSMDYSASPINSYDPNTDDVDPNLGLY